MTCARLETKRRPVDVEAGFSHAVNLVQEINGIEDDAVADDAYAVGANNAAGNELQDKLVLANDDGVPGVMAAGVARHGAEPLAQHVDNLSLTLIAPLGAQHYSRLCSHSPSLIPHDNPPQQFVPRLLRAGMDFGAVWSPATFSILNPACAQYFTDGVQTAWEPA